MKIDIASISLDIQNFRHKNVATEREAMEILLKEDKIHKISELAQDIVEMGGLDPSSLMIVMEDSDHPGGYIALEGNRRLTALKTLINPQIAAGTPPFPTFKALSSRFLALNIKDLECVVEERSKAFAWIKRKHYNAMGGRGVVGWNAIATARSDASEGKYARWMTTLNFLEGHGIDTDELLEGIASKTTTVERVLVSPSIAGTLGLIFDRSGKVEPENGDEAAAARLLVALLKAMGQPDFNEPKVTTASLQREYIEGFAALSVKKNPAPVKQNAGNAANGHSATNGSASGGSTAGAGTNTGAGSSSGGSSSSVGSVSSGSGSGGASAQAAGTASSTTRSKPVKTRKKLAANGLRISNDGLNRFYGELRKLSVDQSPYISSVMNRIFLEKSTMVFLEAMAVTSQNPNGWHDSNVKLRSKVGAVLGVIDPKKKIRSLEYARDIANAAQDKIHTLDSMNEAIHDHKAIPSTQEIITVWDRLHPYYEEIFNYLEKNGK
ncbi:hypothetical protein [Rhizobium sp. ZW T2_16]|uniref:hypothetical protein n=1 Tax=Rhizobium sp. ZW T2_16 TaxID=3378083 RepID=UPI0038535970